jgi:hypothetical protein
MKIRSLRKTAINQRETGGLGRRYKNDIHGPHVGKFRGTEFQFFLNCTKILTGSVQFIFVLTIWTVTTRVKRQARALQYFSIIFNYVIVFRKSTEYEGTYVKWAHPRFTQ